MPATGFVKAQVWAGRNILSPPETLPPNSTMELKVVADTFFKLSVAQSSTLSDREKVWVPAGTTYALHSHAPAQNGHVKVALKDAALGSEGRNTWFVYAPHIEITGNEPGNRPNDTSTPVPRQGDAIRLPGFQSTFYLSAPIVAGGHFTWAEATKNGTRIPADRGVVEHILKIATAMEEVRERLGSKAITINSWYRDPATNRRVGGAPQSRHIAGDAVDFVVAGLHPYKVYDLLDPWWGGRGGLASATVFTHIDARGYKARWSYGF